MKNEKYVPTKYAPIPPDDQPDPFVIGFLLALMVILFFMFFLVPGGCN